MEAPKHGKEKKEGPGEKHRSWVSHAMNGLKAIGIGVGIAVLAPPLLASIGVYMQPYLYKLLAWGGAGAYLYKKYKGVLNTGGH